MSERPVLILGAGINGASLARELALNGVATWVVDKADVASGATSKSSRLIHGGLRYLEYGEFKLVREALAERDRLLRLAPHYVRPLSLAIPVSRRGGGWWPAAARFFGRAPRAAGPRGLWLARTGMWLYDRFAKNSPLHSPRVVRVGEAAWPQVDAGRYRWLCVYADAQMKFPERYTLALLQDGQQAAAEQDLPWHVLTYHQARLEGRAVQLHDLRDASAAPRSIEPALIVNATGAWGDTTLAGLDVPSRRLFGGSKGSHLLTAHPALRAALGETAVYAETRDGRFVFVLPFGERVLVGTTEEPFRGDPHDAAASAAEIDYLLELTAEVFPQAAPTRDDVLCHYSGVRPLPYAAGTDPGAVTRDHRVEVHEQAGLGALTLIGGKLTTSRLLGEQAADLILARLGRPRSGSTRERPLPAAATHPAGPEEVVAQCRELARRTGFQQRQIDRIWELYGPQTEQIVGQLDAADGSSLPGTDIPRALARWSIRHEWVRTAEDLLARRLMAVFTGTISRATLRAAVDLLVEQGVLEAGAADAEFAACAARLEAHYGCRLASG